MTLAVSWCMFILVQFIIYTPVQSCTTDSFNNKWFGANCQYKCHCKNNVACDVTNGDCPNGCDIGWFGPACQYADIATNKPIKLANGASQSTTKITDGDDTTCASLTGSNASLEVNWDSEFYFTWLRIIVGNIELQKGSLSIKFADNVTSECSTVFVDNVTMDIYCNVSKPIKKLLLNGAALGTVCSLYVSQGRNVALMQSTDQTSDFYESSYYNSGHIYYYYNSSKAVDGSYTFGNYGCTHTRNDGEDAPTLSLHFNTVVSVTHYKIFNRVKDPNDIWYTSLYHSRLKGFILKTFDHTNNIVQYYTDNETSVLDLYNVLSTNTSAPVLSVQITATQPAYDPPFLKSILTLCEVEIYGDSLCLQHKYGRDCENVCNCAVKGEKCFVSTGNCQSGCKAGFYGQGCTKPKCSSNCNINSTDKRICDSESGRCVSGCRKGFEGPDCTITTSELDNEKGLASGVGIGIGVMMAADILIVVVIYMWFKRRQQRLPKPADNIYDRMDPTQQKENPYFTVDKSGDGYDLIKYFMSFNKTNNPVIIVDGTEIYNY